MVKINGQCVEMGIPAIRIWWSFALIKEGISNRNRKYMATGYYIAFLCFKGMFQIVIPLSVESYCLCRSTGLL